jgi:hypothetical protein
LGWLRAWWKQKREVVQKVDRDALIRINPITIEKVGGKPMSGALLGLPAQPIVIKFGTVKNAMGE